MKNGAALYRFVKEGLMQNVIHNIKYRNRYDVAHTLGKRWGEQMLDSDIWEKADYIIPIPLHISRHRQRGYNQSMHFAKGIKEATGIEIKDDILIKYRKHKSQTRKSRTNRFENVLNSFKLKNSELLDGKTILLVDDVMTTGATIEAAYQLLSKSSYIKFQIGLIALADG